MEHADPIPVKSLMQVVDSFHRPALIRHGSEVLFVNQSARRDLGLTVETGIWPDILPNGSDVSTDATRPPGRQNELVLFGTDGHKRRFMLEEQWVAPEMTIVVFDEMTTFCDITDSYLASLVALREEMDSRRSVERGLKSAQARLRQSEERYKSVFMGNRVPELLIDPGADGQILDANPAAEQFYGWDRATLASMRVSDINMLSAAEIKREMAAAQSEQRSHFFFRHRRSDGEIRDVEVHSGPVRLGEKDLLFSIIHDITDRKLAEARLKILSAAVSQSSAMVLITDRQTRIEYVNPAFSRVTGYELEEVIGKTPSFLKSGVHPAAMYSQLRDTLEAGQAWRGEFLNRDKNGNRFWVSAVISPVADDQGEVTHYVSVEDDISSRKRTEDRLRLAATVFDAANEAIMVTNAQGHIQAVNRAFSTVTGFSADEMLGETPERMAADSQEKDFHLTVRAEVTERGQWSGEVWSKRKNGEVFPEWLSITAVRDEEKQLTHYVSVFSDISQRKAAEERVHWQATHDPLTELPNRALFMDRLSQAVTKAERSGSRFALMFLDLDRFKEVNDTFGHEAGDSLLRQATRRMLENIRISDTAARLAGDEFTVILPELPDALDAQRVARKLVLAMRRPFFLEPVEEEAEVTASIGIAVYPEDGDTADALMRCADTAMYAAKRAGRNAYRFHRPDFNTHLNKQMALEHELSAALDAHQMDMRYQPVLSMDGTRLFGIDAQLCWHRDNGELMPASEFLQTIRDPELTARLSGFALQRLVADGHRWSLPKPPLMILSLRARAFRDDHLPRLVRQLSKGGAAWPSDRLAFGVPEDRLEALIDTGSAALAELEKLGVGLVLDRFGSGDASMTVVRKLRVRLIRLSERLTGAAGLSADSRDMIEAVARWAEILKLPVCAAGVDTDELFAPVRDTGCPYIQGALTLKPLTAERFGAYLAREPLEIE